VSRLVVNRTQLYDLGYPPFLGHFVGFGSPNSRISIRDIQFREIFAE
jgi:hypothetical protein